MKLNLEDFDDFKLSQTELKCLSGGLNTDPPVPPLDNGDDNGDVLPPNLPPFQYAPGVNGTP